MRNISYLGASDLDCYIQILHLTTLYPFPYKLLKKFLILKELRLNYTSKPKEYEMQLLNYDLHIVDIFSNLSRTMSVAPNIKTLIFVSCIMHHNIDLLITEKTSNVMALKFIGYDPPHIVLDLKTLHLKYLGLRPHAFDLRGDFRNLVAVRSMNETGTGAYDEKEYHGLWNDIILPGSNPLMYDSLLGKPYDKKGRPVCPVLCSLLKKLVINDRNTC
ncbi:hypothetical protein K501DRAFT_270173 [Backusella circina FSU 941]|nr:hypothetical protein K501DRAFT_270173 [Backusella circina FSU 941]